MSRFNSNLLGGSIDTFLDWRGVEVPCETCKGKGVQYYPSTSTWRGGVGGARVTLDVCSTCWGTGDKHRKGVNLKELFEKEEQRIAEAAVNLLGNAVGAYLTTTRPAIQELITELERLAQGRKTRPANFNDIVTSLVATLRRAIQGTP